MSVAPQPILDYASPRPRGKVRLPAQSLLDVRVDVDSVVVIERLTGKFGAIAAVLFSGTTVTLLLSLLWKEIFRAMWRGNIGPALFGLTLPAAGYVLIALVINNTWRRTILSANADGVRLRFFAPLGGSRRYAWEADQIEAVRVESNDPKAPLGIDLVRSGTLAELQVHPTGGAVAHLFTDHEAFRLVPIAEAVMRAIGRGGTQQSVRHYPLADSPKD
jgi:hypothetical protein